MTKFIETPVVSHEAALDAVRIAIEEGAKRGVFVSVTVVDPGLGLVAFGKATGATPHSVETSRRKANAAASTRRPTGWLPDASAVILSLGTGNLTTNIHGGFPLKYSGRVVGGLGIAGGTVEQDAEVAIATIAAIGADAQ
jgi:glc operon protein GlcG